jgi:YidC/Oxa1 family membrane protein insertase
MAESVNGGSKTPAQPPKEMSMEVRLLVAFLLMGLVMFLTPYFFKSQTPPAGNKDVTGQTASQGATGALATPSGQPTAAVTPPPAAAAEAEVAAAPLAAGATPQKPEPACIIDTDLYKIVFSNQGGTVRSWQLKKAKGNDHETLNLVNTAAGMDFPFSLHFPEQKPPVNVNWTWYQQTVDPDGLGVTYEFSDGHTSVRKVFRFQKASYLSTVSTEVTLDGKPVPQMIQWRGGFGDLTIVNAAGDQRTLYFDVAANKLVEQSPKSASKGPVSAGGNYSFAGIADKYFAAVFLTEGSSAMQTVTFEDTVKTIMEKTKEVPLSGVALSDGPLNRFELFVGPKDIGLLKKINPKLESVVDFGWMAFLAKPLFLIVNYVNDTMVHNFGWAIVLVTVVINFVLFPLKLSNMKSMRKMQALKPQIDAINAKYKNIGIRDPKKGEQNEEVMGLYKKHGVNPMGGCLPMLLQMPFFFAFYKVFTVSVEMRGAPWLWVPDLSQAEPWEIKVLPLVMIASQFIMQKMTPQAAGDPSQQKMMMFMPLVFGFMFYHFPSGLVLYYLTSNLVSMGQQWFFNKTSMATVAAESIGPMKKIGRK